MPEVGRVHFERVANGQLLLPEFAIRPYGSGPDLLYPRPNVRILPGKLSGEPHVEGTRILTSNLFALQSLGYSSQQIQEMYPAATLGAIEQALDLEKSLAAA
jgi:uncharacterized protein (DUF433 family)